MTRTEQNTFLKTGVNGLTPAIEYGRGRLSEWNSLRNHSYPAAWHETDDVSASVTTNLMQESWNVRLHIAMKDQPGWSNDDYENLVDQCDEIAQNLIIRYNLLVAGSKLVTISDITRTPFIKKNSDLITGVILAFTLNAPQAVAVPCE